jgi:NAD(P)-dependent dehydrogenase (short-subunit alcohol dehydrogenase family)
MDELKGRAAIITGANRGLGLAIAEAYVVAGADVFLCGRDASALASARESLVERAGAGQQVLAQAVDVSDERQVKTFVAQAVEALPSVCILVNNAGVYGPKGPIESVSSAEWVRSIEINLYGSVFMCAALVPHFKRRRYGKIVQLSGGGATNPLPRLSAYAASKAAVVRFAETLAEEVREHGIDVNSVAPGALNTRLLDEVLAAGPERVGEAFYAKALAQKSEGGAPLTKGAALAVFLGAAASDGITGKLLSAIWDPWSELPEHLEALRTSDVYTLRRIVPRDRGLDWG